VERAEKEPTVDRRSQQAQDRRRHSRSGRRKTDPHTSSWHWRRIAWLFAAYGALMSVRTLPASVRRLFARRTLE
jgi:hypothetical protein